MKIIYYILSVFKKIVNGLKFIIKTDESKCDFKKLKENDLKIEPFKVIMPIYKEDDVYTSSITYLPYNAVTPIDNKYLMHKKFNNKHKKNNSVINKRNSQYLKNNKVFYKHK